MKAIFFALLGAGAMYLYLNPGDVDGLTEMAREGVNSAAERVAEATENSPTDALKGYLE